MPKKIAQANIISFMLIIGLSLFLVAGTFYWLLPTIREINSLNDVKSIERQMLTLHNAITQVSREKSQRTVPININKGTIRVRDDSIFYKGFYHLPEAEKGNEILVYGGINVTTSSGGNRLNCSRGTIGRLGFDEPACLLRKGSVEIELRYLHLNDTFTGNIYRIKFRTSKRSHGGPESRYINVEWVNRTIREDGDKRNTTSYIAVDIY
ncbi:MAG: hypothetical protein JSW73_04695 [Candidatus Woesearchaeota archaeon]|nr:MAG: hypothetical protein JSW73_04695 [Candidatus Woesearchaeota archaeon]